MAREPDDAAGSERGSGPALAISGRASEITELLTAEILRGAWPAGSPLRQAPLAERFAVSRTPVREALHELVALGLATFQPNSGFRVRGISQAEYLEAMLIRSRLEGLAAARATMRATTAQLGQLRGIVADLDTIGTRLENSKGSRYHAAQRAWSRENEAFHDLLVECAECPPLVPALSTTVRAYPRDVTWLAVERYPRVLSEYSEDHNGICEAVASGDPDLARARARAHVERALDYLRRVFQSGEEPSESTTDAPVSAAVR